MKTVLAKISLIALAVCGFATSGMCALSTNVTDMADALVTDASSAISLAIDKQTLILGLALGIAVAFLIFRIIKSSMRK